MKKCHYYGTKKGFYYTLWEIILTQSTSYQESSFVQYSIISLDQKLVK